MPRSPQRKRVHLPLIDDARRGLADIAAGRTQQADAGIAAPQALDELRTTVIHNIRRFPRIGRGPGAGHPQAARPHAPDGW